VGEELGIVKAGLKVVGSVPNPSEVKIRGINLTVSGMNIPSTAATLRTGTSDVYEISNVLVATAFPSVVAFFKEFQIRWELSLDNGANWAPVGTSSNPIYVCLADPVVNPATMFRTLVHLACSNTGATTASGAAAKTWELFSEGGSSPKNVKTWNDVALYYYKPGTIAVPDNAVCSIATFLQSHTGQCSVWAHLLQDAWSVNGVTSDYVTATVSGKTYLFVSDWSALSTTEPFWYQRTQTPLNDMWPGPPGLNPPSVPSPYGYYDNPNAATNKFLNLTTLGGQGSGAGATPSQKIFRNHQFLKFNGTYYDPSYGVTYANASAFQAKCAGWGEDAVVVDGYATVVFGTFASPYLIQFTEQVIATIVAGVSDTVFTVASGQGANFTAGMAVRIRIMRAPYYGKYEYKGISSVSGDTITLQSALPATPAAGDTMGPAC
jgi:hypothetical protein